MAENSDSPLGGPLELPEDDTTHQFAPPPQKSPKKAGKKIAIIVVVVIVLALAGLGIWKLTQKKAKPSSSNTPAGSGEAQNTQAPYTTTTTTKSYTNNVMRMTLAYPENWKVTEDVGSFKIESPEFNFQTIDKGTVTGNFRVYVRQGAQETDSKYIGRGYAIEPSEKIVYTQPTASQRKETYLTNFGLDQPDNFAYFLIAGNFNLQKGETLGPNYGKEAETLIIGGGFSSKDFKDGLQTYKVSTDSYKESTAYKQAVDIIKSIQVQ